MPLLISDSNIFIDMESGGLLEFMLRQPILTKLIITL
jgi:hypothetical protein